MGAWEMQVKRLSLAPFALAAGVAVAQEGGSPSPDAPWEDAESAVVAAERMRAHERMPDTMYASTPSEDKPYFAHPTPAPRHSDDMAERDDRRRAAAWFQPLNTTGGETAEDVFRQSISDPVVQSKCVNCHVFGGISGHTRLVFAPATTNDHVSRNYRVFEDFVVSVPNAAALILDKIKGVAHGGGVQVPAGSALYADMQRFLNLLDGGDAAPLTAETLFDTVRMRPRRETLYRAAIILAGRIPTEAEYAALESATLLSTVRGLMTGQGFHNFLIRAANDRLLTDGAEPFLTRRFVNYWDAVLRLNEAVDDGVDGSVRARSHYHAGLEFGLRRAPLELVAHVVENDLPYTEILTADYTMANPQAALGFGANVSTEEFANADDVHEFRPVRIEGYYPSSSLECDGTCSVVGPALDYPHAGILGTRSLLYRYPTTPTNRNRARGRWTYYHFLGVDVERLGVRTLDPNSLVDEDNPAMNNPACTRCHGILDPVAGTFQHYDEFGRYKSRGRNSLPYSYTNPTVYATIDGKALAPEPEIVAFRSHLPDRGQVSTSIEFYAEGDGLVHVGKLSVLNTDGRSVFEIERANALGLPFQGGDDCRHAEDHLVLEDGCWAWFNLPMSSSSNSVGMAAGDYHFEVIAWSSGGTSLRAELWYKLYQSGDTWFRDMRKPGFDGQVAPEATDSLEWLGGKIAEDRRFAEATVKFWWPAIMGSEVARPPTDRSDVDFESRLLEAQAQGAEVERLARMFRNGSRGGRPYNVKDLLAELVLSRWFRAKHITDANQVRRAALQSAGAARPLTPEELVAKTEALTDYVWGRERKTYGPKRDRPRGYLQDIYAPLYGGIDSEDVTERSRRFTAPAAQVAKLHANTITILVAIREFLLLPDERRRLFSGIDLSDTPEAAPDAIKAKLAELQEKFFGARPGAKDVQDAYRFFEDAWRNSASMYPRLARWVTDTPGRLNDYYFWERCVVNGGLTDDCYLEGIRDDALVEWGVYSFTWSREVVRELGDGVELTEEEMRMAMTWSTMLAAMFMDYRYLHL